MRFIGYYVIWPDFQEIYRVLALFPHPYLFRLIGAVIFILRINFCFLLLKMITKYIA